MQTMLDVLVGVSILLNVVVIWLLSTRNLAQGLQDFITQQLMAVEKGQERIEKVLRDDMAQARIEAARDAKSARDELAASLRVATKDQREAWNSFANQLTNLTQVNEQKLDNLRKTVQDQLKELREDNNTQLEQMRTTVDEKLHQTLEQRLTESFKR